MFYFECDVMVMLRTPSAYNINQRQRQQEYIRSHPKKNNTNYLLSVNHYYYSTCNRSRNPSYY